MVLCNLQLSPVGLEGEHGWETAPGNLEAMGGLGWWGWGKMYWVGTQPT